MMRKKGGSRTRVMMKMFNSVKKTSTALRTMIISRKKPMRKVRPW